MRLVYIFTINPKNGRRLDVSCMYTVQRLLVLLTTCFHEFPIPNFKTNQSSLLLLSLTHSWHPNHQNFVIYEFFKYHSLEVGNLGDTEAADNADFNALEVPPGGVAESSPSHPDQPISRRLSLERVRFFFMGCSKPLE